VRWYEESEEEAVEHVEETALIDLSRAGARLSLSEAVEIGQPLRLSLALPPILRAYDKNEPLYNVWAIVRSLACLMSSETGWIRYEIGVAFMGQHPPPGYLEAPEKRYDLKPTPDADGFWHVREIFHRQY
jgi:hypothetical protein